MAVVAMRKVEALVHQSDIDVFLGCLQKHSVMEFTPVEHAELTNLTLNAPHAELLSRATQAVQFLTAYETVPGLWRRLRDGVVAEYSEADIASSLQTTDELTATLSDVEALQAELHDTTTTHTSLLLRQTELTAWAAVTNKLSDIKTATTTSVLVGPQDTTVPTKAAIETLLQERDLETYGCESYGDRFLVTFLAADQSTVLAALEDSAFAVLERPEGTDTPAAELSAVAEAIVATEAKLSALKKQASALAASHLKRLRIVSEVATWEQDRFAVLGAGKGTETTAVFTGWLVADAQTKIEAELQEQKVAAVFTEVPLEKNEEPPVEIKNNSFIQPFETITRLYGMPGYKDLDPTVYLAGFFFLFFGLSLTDVGYGVFLMVTAIAVLSLFKVAPIVRVFMKLLFFMGLGSALVGLLFGGYLGIAPEALPSWLTAIQLFDPIGNPLPVFYLALALGVFQVMVGMVLKIYSDARNGQLVDGILDQGPWLFAFSLSILYVGVVTGYVSFVTTDTLIKLIYVAVALIAVASGRKGNGVVGMTTSALLALYDSVGYFSDILSYSRLLALGLATSALAFAVNLIAELVGGTPVVGPILAIIVLIIGHLFTLAVNTLGAFIHSARLQFVEFFGKFIAGSGRTFTPLARSRTYVTARDE